MRAAWRLQRLGREMWLIVLAFVTLTGPDGQVINMNPDEIVSLRTSRGEDHFAKGTRCLVTTTDGKYSTVREACDLVLERIQDARKR